MERTADHCSNIAACIIEADQQDMDLHAFLRDRKKESGFAEKYAALAAEYRLPSQTAAT